jgi:hypothetical protein
MIPTSAALWFGAMTFCLGGLFGLLIGAKIGWDGMKAIEASHDRYRAAMKEDHRRA